MVTMSRLNCRMMARSFLSFESDALVALKYSSSSRIVAAPMVTCDIGLLGKAGAPEVVGSATESLCVLFTPGKHLIRRNPGASQKMQTVFAVELDD